MMWCHVKVKCVHPYNCAQNAVSIYMCLWYISACNQLLVCECSFYHNVTLRSTMSSGGVKKEVKKEIGGDPGESPVVAVPTPKLLILAWQRSGRIPGWSGIWFVRMGDWFVGLVRNKSTSSTLRPWGLIALCCVLLLIFTASGRLLWKLPALTSWSHRSGVKKGSWNTRFAGLSQADVQFHHFSTILNLYTEFKGTIPKRPL